MNKLLLLLIPAVFIFGFCKSGKKEKPGNITADNQQKEISGNITISGAYAITGLVGKWAEEFKKIHRDVTIGILETGTGQGIADLIDNKADLAMISRPLTEEEKESGVWVMPVARDGVALIVNDKNPYLPGLLKKGLSPDEIQKIFTGITPPSWGELLDTAGKDKPVVYTREDESGAADLLAGFCFKKVSDLKGIAVTGDIEMIKSVRNNILSIGFCNLSYAFHTETGERAGNIHIVPFDLDYDNAIGTIEMPFADLETAHRSVWLGVYPENLCRELTLGSMCKPDDPAILAFLDYVINEGQNHVKEAGLCELNSVYLRFARESLQE